MGPVSHKVDIACQAQQTEPPVYTEPAITAIETTLSGTSLDKYRESCNRRARLCLKMVCGMPSSVMGKGG